MLARVLFGALALFDAALLAYLALGYDWLFLDVPDNFATPAAILIIGALWVLLIAEKTFIAAFVFATGSAIAREITGRRDARRGLAVVATFVLLPMLALAAYVFVLAMQKVIEGPPGFIIDRLTFFDGLAHKASGFGAFGTAEYVSGSLGHSLVILLAVAYLSEKYLLGWWRVRWPVPLLPIIAVGWAAWNVHDGEERLRAWVAAQQWRPVAVEQTWLEALDTCASMGAGWRLPRREELARYLSTEPPEVRGLKGAAWTGTALDGEGWAVAVDLNPRKSGRWNKGSEPTRDESLCEYRDERGQAHDWFTRLRPEVCARTMQSAYLYTPGQKITALQSGNIGVSQPTGAVVCTRPADDAAKIGIRSRRGYRDAQDFVRGGDFLAYMAQSCAAKPGHNLAACFTYAPDLPAFEESGDEKTFRAFCALALNGEGCDRYAQMMDARPDSAQRALRYRDLACKRGYKPACTQSPSPEKAPTPKDLAPTR